MRAVNLEKRGTKNGKEIMQAIIISDSVPATLPTTGDGIVGMNDNMIFAPMSLLYVVGDADSKVYITNESGTFVPQ